jgi:hypothetical protein
MENVPDYLSNLYSKLFLSLPAIAAYIQPGVLTRDDFIREIYKSVPNYLTYIERANVDYLIERVIEERGIQFNREDSSPIES